MFREFVARLFDPRLRRPIAGVVLSYLAWVLTLVLVSRFGWTEGSGSQRLLAAALPMLPILGLLAFFMRLHSRGDEVERAMHLMAAAAGFGAMLVVSLLAMHLERVAAPLQLTATHIWSVGMLAWLFGLVKAFRGYR